MNLFDSGYPMPDDHIDPDTDTMENTLLRRELAEAKQYNDLFRRCTRRALDLWLERHPNTKMWPDTAENICWLAEENERLREALGFYADPDNWCINDYPQRDAYMGYIDGKKAHTEAQRALEGNE